MDNFVFTVNSKLGNEKPTNAAQNGWRFTLIIRTQAENTQLIRNFFIVVWIGKLTYQQTWLSNGVSTLDEMDT